MTVNKKIPIEYFQYLLILSFCKWNNRFPLFSTLVLHFQTFLKGINNLLLFMIRLHKHSERKNEKCSKKLFHQQQIMTSLHRIHRNFWQIRFLKNYKNKNRHSNKYTSHQTKKDDISKRITELHRSRLKMFQMIWETTVDVIFFVLECG